MCQLTVQEILRQHFESFSAEHNLPSHVLRAAKLLRDCRTAALGGHLRRCPDGHFCEIAYNSCRHRFCTLCNAFVKAKWLDAWRQRLLPVAHHHIVFTVPHDLNPLWLYNKRLFTKLLFNAAGHSLIELLSDPQFLGARPGILAALHTWNQKLQTHIHVHAAVTAGGLDRSGKWLVAKRECLLPRKVLMIKFRGKLRAFLLKHLEKMRLPAGTTRLYWRNELNRLGRQAWNVKLMERYAHARGVLNYLARYLRGGPIGNKRLLTQADGMITFRYRLPADHGKKAEHDVMHLRPDQFLARLLQHVPPAGMRTVRGYGLYSGNRYSRLDRAHAELGSAPPPQPIVPLRVESFFETLGIESKKCCPECGKPLQELAIRRFSLLQSSGARSPPWDVHSYPSILQSPA
jgi:hypothetical protein